MIFTALPRASGSHGHVAPGRVELLDGLELEVAPRVADVGGPDAVVERTTPPASSIRIIIDVPERGRPETTTIGAPNRLRRSHRLIIAPPPEPPAAAPRAVQ